MITVTLNGSVIGGCGQDYILPESNVLGLGIPDVKPLDLDVPIQHGAAAARDYLTTRTLGIPILIYRKDDPSAAMAAARSLKTSWQPTKNSYEDVLTIESASIGPSNDIMTFFGRPRGGLDLDFEFHHKGLIRGYGSFLCLDPLGYGDEENDSGTNLSILNSGDATTDRIEIVLTGNGGTPTITNANDDNRAIKFGTFLANGATRQIDVRSKTVMNGSTDAYSNLSPTNQWFDLVPGTNSITVTGASSIDITWRSAWF